MAENSTDYQDRIGALTDFSRRLINGENGNMLIAKHRHIIDTVTPTEAMQVLHILLSEGYPNEVVKAHTGKIINVFFKSLRSFQWAKPGEGHFLCYLMLENRGAEKIMREIKSVIKVYYKKENDVSAVLRDELRLLVERLKNYELHYIKKENILFPHLERSFPQYRCLQIMWSFHDDFRRSLKTINQILQSELPDKELLNKEIGKLFFVVLPIIFREEQIVFPVALTGIPAEDWTEMMEQSFETGWCYIEQPARKYNTDQASINPEGKVNMGTGFLSPDQLILLLNNLPVDITYIDENDEVQYFSGGKHRIFHRAKAIIGRKVQNCHPPESVHIVNEIIHSFRTGQKDHADFWIQNKDRFLYIRYFALRNELAEYKGTIEVSQDVTKIRQLEGERRLLKWND